MSAELHWFFVIALVLAHAGMSYVDSSTWWVRTFAPTDRMGFYIGRTNVYSYFGRAFAFTFAALLSFMVDTGSTPLNVCVAITIAFAVGGLLQPTLLNHGPVSQRVLMTTARLIGLTPEAPTGLRAHVADSRKLTVYCATSTFFFSMALSLPYVTAAVFPQFRLTISSTSQILNSFGMIFILTFVDQRLFASWDKAELAATVAPYTRGRAIGMLSAAIVLGGISLWQLR